MTSLKNRGGLVYIKNGCFDLFRKMEVIFKKLEPDKDDLAASFLRVCSLSLENDFLECFHESGEGQVDYVGLIMLDMLQLFF